jgi:hypothetical protein
MPRVRLRLRHVARTTIRQVRSVGKAGTMTPLWWQRSCHGTALFARVDAENCRSR